MAEDQEIRGLIPNLAERQAPLEFNQFEATALYLSATQSYTMTLDNIPAEWIIWTGPGAAGSALVYVYTEGNGLTGRRIELGASGYVRLPARGQRAISVYVATGTNVYVGLAAVSGLNTCFDIRPGI